MSARLEGILRFCPRRTPSVPQRRYARYLRCAFWTPHKAQNRRNGFKVNDNVGRCGENCDIHLTSEMAPTTQQLGKRGYRASSNVGCMYGGNIHPTFGTAWPMCFRRSAYFWLSWAAECMSSSTPHPVKHTQNGYTLFTDRTVGRTLTTAWWQTRPIHLLGVTGFDRVGLRWAAGRGRLATLNRGTVKLN